jgi:hypothetical protein
MMYDVSEVGFVSILKKKNKYQLCGLFSYNGLRRVDNLCLPDSRIRSVHSTTKIRSIILITEIFSVYIIHFVHQRSSLDDVSENDSVSIFR